jgi:hypothetical protein
VISNPLTIGKSCRRAKKNSSGKSEEHMIGLYILINQQILTYLFPVKPGTGIGTLKYQVAKAS